MFPHYLCKTLTFDSNVFKNIYVYVHVIPQYMLMKHAAFIMVIIIAITISFCLIALYFFHCLLSEKECLVKLRHRSAMFCYHIHHIEKPKEENTIFFKLTNYDEI